MVDRHGLDPLKIDDNGKEDGRHRAHAAKELGIENSIKFLGNRNDVPEILQIIDVFVLPSLYEGMSNALMEAMATGLPIIATDIPENRELLSSKDSGILIPARDSSALADKISFIIRNKVYAEKAGMTAKKEARNHFSLDTTVHNFISLLEKR